MKTTAEAKKAKHIRNYARVRKMILARYAKERRDSEAELERLKNGTAVKDTWQTPEQRIARLEGLLRPPTVQKNGKIKYQKDTYAYWEKQALDRLDAADRAGVVTEITFKIEWRRSRTWGLCPSCETWVRYDGEPQDFVLGDDGKPHMFSDGQPIKISTHYSPRTCASGAGYDKRSTVMSDGVQCPAVDRLVIEHEKCWERYAIEGKNELPRLSFGGKGVETLRDLFKEGYKEGAPIPGFEWEWQEGKTWDFINIRKKSNGRRKG